MVQESFEIGCIPPGEAAALVRPLLRLQANSVKISANAPRLLTAFATPDQLDQVRAVLEPGAVARSCAAGGAGQAR
jgi:hypothetical protein